MQNTQEAMKSQRDSGKIGPPAKEKHPERQTVLGAIVVLFTLIPLLLSIKYHRQRQAEKNSAA